MKKVLWLVVCLMTMVLASCSTPYLATANYDVCYPDGTKTVNETMKISSMGDEPIVKCYSIGGTNYISAITTDTNFKREVGSTFISTTAPLRLISYEVVSLKKKKDRKDDVYR